MSLRGILRWPDARLGAICAPIAAVSPEIEVLAHDMIETMYAAPGRGLAAPQVGELVRLFVMDATWKDGADRAPEVFINPQIVDRDDAETTCAEGCLSLPGITVPVSRPARVETVWLGLDGQSRRAWFEGFAAACVQHEVDHLDGVVTLDRVDADTRARVLKAYSEALA